MASFSLCGNLNIQKCACFFRCGKKPDEDEVLYLERKNNISIISHGKKERFSTLLPSEIYTKLLYGPDTKHTDDKLNKKNQNSPVDYCLFGVTPTDDVYILCQSGNVFGTHIVDDKSFYLSNFYSAHVQNFLEPIFQQTLKGKSLQMQLNIDSTTYLMQTFPICAPHNKKLILSGLCVTSEYMFNIDINKFVVNPNNTNNDVLNYDNECKDSMDLNDKDNNITITEYDPETEDVDTETEVEDYNKLTGGDHSGILI